MFFSPLLELCCSITWVYIQVGNRFDAICSGCVHCPSCTVEKHLNVPTCSVAIDHSISPGGYNVTLMTLVIEKGYWRTTSESVRVLSCYNADACNGGLTATRDFCRTGYKGPCEISHFFLFHVNGLDNTRP